MAKADDLLAQIREDVATYGDILDRSHLDSVERFFRAVRDLDDLLSAGGTPPEAWREGPDAPGADSAARPTATLTRDIDVAESTAARSHEIAVRQPHPTLSGELRRAGGFAEGAAAYARLVRDGEMSDELAKLLDI